MSSKIFLDTEFSGLVRNAELLSLALVPEEGPWFYAVFTDVEHSRLNEWVRENVVPHLDLTPAQLEELPPGRYVRGDKSEVVAQLKSFLAGFDHITIWADVPAYDWVFFCDLFGGALHLPKNIHYIVRDLATLFEAKGHDIDTSRFDFAYGGVAAGAVVSKDGRVEGEPGEVAGLGGLVRHCALGDGFAGLGCWRKIMMA